MARELKKSQFVGFKTTPEIVEKIEKFQQQKIKELGFEISKNQAIEILILDGLTVNEKK